MNNRILWALVGLNVLLAVTLAMRLTEKSAVAQARRPADYILIPGEVNGGASAVVYMIDTTNSMLGAMVYDDAAKAIGTMPPIDLAHVFQTGPIGPAGAGTGAGAGAGPGRPPAGRAAPAGGGVNR